MVGIGHLLKLVYYLKTGFRVFNVFNNNVLDLLKKGRTSFFYLLTELNDLFRSYNELILIHLYHEIILTFYSLVLNLDIMDLLAVGFIN